VFVFKKTKPLKSTYLESQDEKLKLGSPGFFCYINIMIQENYISLYDYLGKAAGVELGKQIYEYAKIKNIKPQIREIKNPKYTGKVMLYPKSLIHEFFQIKKSFING
jgi:hypothetical protein